MDNLFKCIDPVDGEPMGLVLVTVHPGINAQANLRRSWYWFMLGASTDDNPNVTHKLYEKFERNLDGFVDWFNKITPNFRIERATVEQI